MDRATADVFLTRQGVPMEFLTTPELLEEFANRGHNYVLIYADPKQPNEALNFVVDYVPDATPVLEEDPDGMVTNGLWMLWALAQAFVALYDKNLAWYEAEDGALTPKPRVNNRLRRIYNECESLLDTTPAPFQEPEP